MDRLLTAEVEKRIHVETAEVRERLLLSGAFARRIEAASGRIARIARGKEIERKRSTAVLLRQSNRKARRTLSPIAAVDLQRSEALKKNIEESEEARQSRLHNLHVAQTQSKERKPVDECFELAKKRLAAREQSVASFTSKLKHDLASRLQALNNDASIQAGFFSPQPVRNKFQRALSPLAPSPTTDSAAHAPHHMMMSPHSKTPIPGVTSSSMISSMVNSCEADAVATATCLWIQSRASDESEARKLADQVIVEMRREANLVAQKKRIADASARRVAEEQELTRIQLGRAVELAQAQTVQSVRALTISTKMGEKLTDAQLRLMRLPRCMQFASVFSVQDLEKVIMKSIEESMQEKQEFRRRELASSVEFFHVNVRTVRSELGIIEQNTMRYLEAVRSPGRDERGGGTCAGEESTAASGKPSRHCPITVSRSPLMKTNCGGVTEAQKKLLLASLRAIEKSYADDSSEEGSSSLKFRKLLAQVVQLSVPSRDEGGGKEDIQEVSFSAKGCSTLSADDVILLDDVMDIVPINALGIEGVAMSADATRLLVERVIMRQRSHHPSACGIIRLAMDSETALQPPSVADEIAKFVRKTRELLLHRRGLRIAKAKLENASALEAQEQRQLPHVKKRALASVQLLIEFFAATEKTSRELLRIMEREARSLLQVVRQGEEQRIDTVVKKREVQVGEQENLMLAEAEERTALDSLAERNGLLLTKEFLNMKQVMRRMSRKLTGLLKMGTAASKVFGFQRAGSIGEKLSPADEPGSFDATASRKARKGVDGDAVDDDALFGGEVELSQSHLLSTVGGGGGFTAFARGEGGSEDGERVEHSNAGAPRRDGEGELVDLSADNVAAAPLPADLDVSEIRSIHSSSAPGRPKPLFQSPPPSRQRI